MTRADSGAQSRGVCLGLKRGQVSGGLHDAKGQFWGLGCQFPPPAFADPKPRPSLSLYLVGGCQVWHVLRVPNCFQTAPPSPHPFSGRPQTQQSQFLQLGRGHWGLGDPELVEMEGRAGLWGPGLDHAQA